MKKISENKEQKNGPKLQAYIVQENNERIRYPCKYFAETFNENTAQRSESYLNC